MSQLPSILGTQINNRPKKIAQQVRERYNDYFNGEWSIEWQDRMINIHKNIFLTVMKL